MQKKLYAVKRAEDSQDEWEGRQPVYMADDNLTRMRITQTTVIPQLIVAAAGGHNLHRSPTNGNNTNNKCEHFHETRATIRWHFCDTDVVNKLYYIERNFRQPAWKSLSMHYA